MTTSADGLHDRLDFIGLDAAASSRLRSMQDFIAKSIGPALDTFYAKVRQTPDVARFFSDERHMSGAQSRQADHWRIITEGRFGAEYAEGVRKIGETHARLGLEPQWYIGGYALVLEQLIKASVARWWPSLKRRTRPEDMAD
ncbi:MAG: protoglobin domain-containing protein, partial [Caulobacteraceae bacterium]|nr:protoglobin domain-containing protein [Caulobacteraceae bacterium]